MVRLSSLRLRQKHVATTVGKSVHFPGSSSNANFLSALFWTHLIGRKKSLDFSATKLCIMRSSRSLVLMGGRHMKLFKMLQIYVSWRHEENSSERRQRTNDAVRSHFTHAEASSCKKRSGSERC